ncbi:MAG: hypothetical protein DMD55_08505 [Gemmatimonadetes bacterium]|nr:MAG: hypothetical protein DMD55_08505 [Gemmatimonadota bacterium]
MTFKHKLSRRLALLKDRTVLFAAATLAAALISCERPFATDQGADIASLVVWPKTVTLQQNQTTDFVAFGMTTAGDTVLVAVSWSVTGGSIVDSTTSRGQHYGHYKAGADPGNFKVVGKHLASGKSDTATAVVSPVVVPVAAVVVAPATANVMVDSAVQLVAIPVDSAGTALGGRAVTWTSGAAGVATVDGSGLVTGRAAGFAAITATCEGKSGSAAVTVAAPPPAPVASVSVSPASASVSVGQTVQLAATPKDANGNPLTGRTVTWSSGNSGVATVSASGIVTGVSPGAATITAASEGKSGTAAVTVSSVPVASVAVSPTSASVSVGQTVQLAATPKDANGNPLTGRTVTWSSGNTAVATVSASGLVTGVSAGAATITAASEGQSGSAAITVTSVPVASVAVSPASASVQTGQAVQLTATPKDANGNPLSGRTIVWMSSNTAAATVNTSGRVTGVAAGSATITATSEGKSGTAAITVTAPPAPAPVATVAVSPASASVAAGQAVQLSAVTKDSAGTVLTGRTVTWASSNSGIASVSGSGFVTGVTVGAATITATSEGKSGTAAITVTAPPPVTGSCLALPGPTITLSGLSTSPYQNTSLTSGTKIDATAAQWLLNTPDVWGYMGSSSNLCWHSGQILGTIPPSTPYEDNLNGYHLMYGVDVHGASPLVEGLTIFTGGDGITFDAAEDANWTVRDVHMTYIRDDCIENDFLNSGLVDRSFFDGCYDFMSARAYGGGAADGSANTVTVQNSLIRVQGMDKLYPGLSAPGYGGFWKWSGSGSPNTDIGPMLVITNTVFRADAPPVEGNGAGLYMAPVPGKVKSCANNVMVWLGPGSFPEPLPSCFTVLTGQAGRDYWDNAVAQWKAAHPAPVDMAPPIVSLWSPGLAGSSTLTGTVTLVATAVDDQALGGVQFALNGQPIGAEVSTAATPAKFPLTWDSHGLANGTYTLTATARDVAGHRTTSAGVTVTISN